MPCNIDETGIDAAYSCSQKGLGAPPGLAPITISPRALETLRSRTTSHKSWYLDLKLLDEYYGASHRYHHTAPISMFYALREALEIIPNFPGANAGLAEAAVKPYFASMFGGMKVPFVDHGPDLFEGALGQGRHLEHTSAGRTGAGDQRGVTRLLVEVIKDRRTVDQHLAVVQDEGRNASQGADLRDSLRISKDRARVTGEGHAVVVQRHCNAASDRAVILADEDH